jgi:16S rRNA (cytosine967-C5)-methyltransferase
MQRRLLAHAATLVRPGGVLVYATCTLTEAENDAQLASFLATHRQFVVDDPRPLLPESAQAVIGSDGVLRTFPHRHGLDGFFAVRLKRHREDSIVRA